MGKISVADFAKERNVDRNSVNAYIRRNLDSVVGICEVPNKRDRFIDTESDAFEILDKKYPLPTEISVLSPEMKEFQKLKDEYAKIKEELINTNILLNNAQQRADIAQGRVTELQDSNRKLDEKIQQSTRLLESHDEEIRKVKSDAEELKKRNEELCFESSTFKEKEKELLAIIESREEELNRIKRMNLFQRLFKIK